MADETQIIDEGAKGKQVKSSVFALMILSVVIMVLTPVVTVFVFRVMTRETDAPVEDPEEVREIALPAIQVNVADTNGSRYAQLEIVVEVSENRMTSFFQEQSETNPNGRLKRIQATIINIVCDKRIDSLLTTDGKHKLAREIKAALHDLLADDTGGLVTDVYFCGFLIQ